MIRPVLALFLAMLGSACSASRPTVLCPPVELLSREECTHAVQIASQMLPADKRDFTLVEVETRCLPSLTCSPSLSAVVLKFSAAGEQPTFVRVLRDTWRAELFIPTPAPVPRPG